MNQPLLPPRLPPSELQSTLQISTPASSYCVVTLWHLPLFLTVQAFADLPVHHELYDSGLGDAVSVWFPGFQCLAQCQALCGP